MRPIFAITGGITVYFVWLGIELFAKEAFSKPKALLGCVVGTFVFGSYTFLEFRRMMRSEDSKYDEERKWVEESVRIDSRVSDAKEAMRERFALKHEAPGFSLRGSTTVHDFVSQLSAVRVIAKNGFIISVKIDVLNE